MKKLLLITIIFLLSCFVLSFPSKAEASGVFNITVDRTFEVDAQGQMQVTETRTIKNDTSDLYIPKDSSSKSSVETFHILKFRIGPEVDNTLLDKSVATAKILDASGNALSFEKVPEQDSYALKVKYPRDINPGQSIIFKLQYTNYELSEKIGALYDIYIHGFDKDFKFVDGNTSVKYNTVLVIPDSLPEENLVSPEPSSKKDEGGKRSYSFSEESLVGKFVWVQLGKKQIYKFKIDQKIEPTENRKTGFKNEYKIVIPKDVDEAAVTQKVYYSSITPAPSYIRKDEEGNLIGGFNVDSDKELIVTVEGYAEVSLTDLNLKDAKILNLSDISTDMQSYLKPAEYWEVDDPKIGSKANEIKGDEKNVYKIVEKTYKFVVDSIDYSQVKRFGLNERQGAKKTLEGGAAVCMEYADLFLTLARAQGVPARAAFGYGYDSRVPSDKQESHQWDEVYMPGIDKWVSVEVTWGESGTALIGGDLNHFYIYNASKDPNSPAMVESLVHGGGGELNAPDFEISVTDEVPEGSYKTSEDLLKEFPYTGQSFNIQDVVTKLFYFFKGAVEDFGIANTLITLGVLVGIGGVLLFGSTVMGFKKNRTPEVISNVQSLSQQSQVQDETPTVSSPFGQ